MVPMNLIDVKAANILYFILFVAALLVPFFIGQYIDGELFTGWTFVGDWSCRLCD